MKKIHVNCVHLQNYYCQVHKTIVHHVMVLVFVLFSTHTDIAAHAVAREYVYIVLTKMGLEHVINHENVVSFHVNFLPAMLYAKIPTLDKHCTPKEQKKIL